MFLKETALIHYLDENIIEIWTSVEMSSLWVFRTEEREKKSISKTSRSGKIDFHLDNSKKIKFFSYIFYHNMNKYSR